MRGVGLKCKDPICCLAPLSAHPCSVQTRYDAMMAHHFAPTHIEPNRRTAEPPTSQRHPSGYIRGRSGSNSWVLGTMADDVDTTKRAEAEQKPTLGGQTTAAKAGVGIPVGQGRDGHT